MARWGKGLLEGDGPHDGLGSVVRTIHTDLQRYARVKAGRRTPGRVAAAIGILLQAHPPSFEDERIGLLMKLAIAKHLPVMKTQFSPRAIEVLTTVRDGQGISLAARRVDETHPLVNILGPLSVREVSLFATNSARVYVSKIARRCLVIAREMLLDEDADPVEDDSWHGPLGLLLMMEPWVVSPLRIARLQKRINRLVRKIRRESPANLDLATFDEEVAPLLIEAFDILRDRAEGNTPL